MPRICAFTSAATNYLPKAMLLAKSLKRYHPNVDLFYGLCDDVDLEIDYHRDAFSEVISASSLGIENFNSWSFKHNIVELSTAIKPFILEILLERGYDAVFYFDPDIVVFSSLDDLFNLTADASLSLTPHLLHAETADWAIIDNEICALQHGVYNLGYVGVSNNPEGRRFARWWRDRCYSWCYDEISRGLFTDQRWIDLAPALFDDVKIVKDHRFNVAPWNINHRKISGNVIDGFLVNDDKLGFYHFTGFDSGAHRQMAMRNSNNNPDLMKLVEWYENAIEFAPKDPAAKVEWAYARFENGQPIKEEYRRIYRDRTDLQKHFPNPYLSGDSTLHNWLETQGRIEYPRVFRSLIERVTGSL